MDHHGDVDVVEGAQSQHLGLSAEELERARVAHRQPLLELDVLLGRHGHQHHSPGERGRHRLQCKPDAHQHADLGVMAAGVHGARLPVPRLMLPVQQRVQLAKDGHGRAGLTTLDDRAAAGDRDAVLVRQTEPIEPCVHAPRRPLLLEPQLRLVEDRPRQLLQLPRLGLDGPPRFGLELGLARRHGHQMQHSRPPSSLWSVALPAQLASPFAASMPALAHPLTPYRVLDVDGSVIGELPPLADDDFRALLRWMIFGRELDRRALQLQRQGRITVWGPMIGQEATQAGLGFALEGQDLVFPSYREAVALCMQGLDLADLLAYYRGLYWLADPSATGVYPIQIVIGDQTLHAVGAGIGFALQHRPRVAVAVIGDGATSEGDFHEALNFAGVFHARSVIFVQNNGWAISMPATGQTASPTIAQKALGYGIPGILVDGNDALAVFAVSRWALDHARAGDGPVLVEALTYRLGAHTTADDPRRYQSAEEIEAWRQRDPLVRMSRYLEQVGLWRPSESDAASAEALARIDDAFARAEAIATPAFERVVGSTFATPTVPLREQLRQLEADR